MPSNIHRPGSRGDIALGEDGEDRTSICSNVNDNIARAFGYESTPNKSVIINRAIQIRKIKSLVGGTSNYRR